MSRIPHACRRDGRYVFRRRVHFRNLISKPVAIALRTADPTIARQRTALLSARFVVIKSSVDRMIECGRPLSGAEIEALFREELEHELRGHVQRAFENGQWSAAALEVADLDAEVYSLLRSPDRHAPELTEHAQEMIPDEEIGQKLKALGAPVHAGTVAAARTHLIRARAAGCVRVQRLYDDDIMEAVDPVHALMADLGPPSEEVLKLRPASNEQARLPAIQDRAGECQFLIYDDRRFGDVIETMLAELKSEGVWKGDLGQQRRIMQSFAWITGNRELGSYDHRDVAAFKAGLLRLPVTFRFGKPDDGPMSRPFDEVVAELAPLTPEDRRNMKTVNRDLSTMSRVAKHLEQTASKAKVPGAKVMDSAAPRSRSRKPRTPTCGQLGLRRT